MRNDTTAPVTTANAPDGWVANSATVSLSAQDGASGVTETYYSTDGTDPSVPYSAPITLDTEGVHTVKYRSTDAAGNTEQTGSVEVRVDVDAPSVSASAPDGWLNAPYTLAIEATDTASGVEHIYYGIDAEPTIETSGGVEVSAEGVHTVNYAAHDRVGRVSNTGSAIVRIDTVAPITTSTAVSNYTTRADITLSAADDRSGVATTEYRLDGGAWTPGTAVSTTDGGLHTLDFRSQDEAGNVEATHTVTFTIKTRYEDDDPRIAYEGPWTKSANSKRSAGSWSYVNAAGSKAIIHFTGTTAELFASTAPTYGKANLILDGGAPVVVDFYTAAYQHDKKVWSRTDLSETTHTVTVEWTGTKNAASRGTGIGIDALDMNSSLRSSHALRGDRPFMTWYGAWGRATTPSAPQAPGTTSTPQTARSTWASPARAWTSSARPHPTTARPRSRSTV